MKYLRVRDNDKSRESLNKADIKVWDLFIHFVTVFIFPLPQTICILDKKPFLCTGASLQYEFLLYEMLSRKETYHNGGFPFKSIFRHSPTISPLLAVSRLQNPLPIVF